jgi:hypothetical protein
LNEPRRTLRQEENSSDGSNIISAGLRAVARAQVMGLAQGPRGALAVAIQPAEDGSSPM